MGQDVSSEDAMGCQTNSNIACNCYRTDPEKTRPWNKIITLSCSDGKNTETDQCQVSCGEDPQRKSEIAKADQALFFEFGLGNAAPIWGHKIGGLNDSSPVSHQECGRMSCQPYVAGGECICPSEDANSKMEMSSKGLQTLSKEAGRGATDIRCTQRAITVLKEGGNIKSWGLHNFGGHHPRIKHGCVLGICASSNEFAAWLKDGRVVSWGGQKGREQDSSVDRLRGVKKVHATLDAFAALTEKGAVYAWGNPQNGGDTTVVKKRLAKDVQAISSTFSAFAAIKNKGSVVTWGRWGYGGGIHDNEVKKALDRDVKEIVATHSAFAALKASGSVVVWGSSTYGGNSKCVQEYLRRGISRVFSSYGAFAALSELGEVIVWGHGAYGGDSSREKKRLSARVRDISSTQYAFAAIKDMGEVVTWGSDQYGGDIEPVMHQLQRGVRKVHATSYAFAAETEDGSIVTWGHPDYGGNSSVLKNHGPEYSGGLLRVHATPCAFVAVMKNGSSCAWGHCEELSGTEPHKQDVDGEESKRFWIIDNPDDYIWQDQDDAERESVMGLMLSSPRGSKTSMIMKTESECSALPQRDSSLISYQRSNLFGGMTHAESRLSDLVAKMPFHRQTETSYHSEKRSSSALTTPTSTRRESDSVRSSRNG